MAKRAFHGLFFFLLFLSVHVCYSSGTFVGVSYHATGGIKAMQFLDRFSLSPSQLRVSVSDHESLSSLSKTGLSLDLYLSNNQLDALTKPKPSSLSWLKTHVSIVKTVVLTIGDEGDRTGLSGPTRLILPTLKSVHSILASFGNGEKNRPKFSVALPLSLVDVSSKFERDNLCRVLSYLKKVNSYAIIEATINGEEVDESIETLLRKASTLPCENDVPIVLTLKSIPALETRKEISELAHRLSRAAQNNIRANITIAGLYIELVPSNNHRELLSTTTQMDTIFPNPPVQNTPTTPTVVTVNPSPVTVTNPAAPIVTLPLTAPPVTTVPGTQPATNPVTPNPVSSPASYIAGQTWCVAKTGAAETSLQAALDYACGQGADCSQIQQGGGCFNPNTLQSHASYAFNSYFQRNPLPTSCDFGGTAAMVNSNPSTTYCTYPAYASTPTTASPQTTTPVTPTPVTTTPVTPTPSVPTPTPTTPSVPTPTPVITNPATVPTPAWSTVPGSTPPLLNSSSGAGPEFGLDPPPGYSSSSASKAFGSSPLLGFFLLLTSLVMRWKVLLV